LRNGWDVVRFSDRGHFGRQQKGEAVRILIFLFLITIAGCATVDKPEVKEPDVRYEGPGVNITHCPPVTQMVKDQDGTWELKTN